LFGDAFGFVLGGRLFLLRFVTRRFAMGQKEIDEAMASATGEKVRTIRSRGFSIADPFDVALALAEDCVAEILPD
jgi:hypothetical protein